MSIKVMSQVWEDAQVKGRTLLVLLAVADWANDSGLAWPSIDAIAKKARCSIRKVQDALDELTTAGYLLVELNAGPHGVNKYVVQKLHHPAETAPRRNRHNRAPGGAEMGVVFAPDPSGTTILEEPSLKTRAARAQKEAPNWGHHKDQADFILSMIPETADVFTEADVNRLTEKAMSHSARRKYTRLDLYVGDWIRGDAVKERDRRARNGQHSNNPQGTRDKPAKAAPRPGSLEYGLAALAQQGLSGQGNHPP